MFIKMCNPGNTKMNMERYLLLVCAFFTRVQMDFSFVILIK
uniref:Uncharacterized protein n=1 Tax=Lepeophtheirus salmonis TaxID=72036 RepID=A0A0K2V0U2_LEPSM